MKENEPQENLNTPEQEQDHIELEIIPADKIHGARIYFYPGKDKLVKMAYNRAVREVMEENKLLPYYQVDTEDCQGWESMSTNTTIEDLHALTPEIQKRVPEILKKLKDHYHEE